MTDATMHPHPLLVLAPSFCDRRDGTGATILAATSAAAIPAETAASAATVDQTAPPAVVVSFRFSHG